LFDDGTVTRRLHDGAEGGQFVNFLAITGWTGKSIMIIVAP
jgi:hypothetical protein